MIEGKKVQKISRSEKVEVALIFRSDGGEVLRVKSAPSRQRFSKVATTRSYKLPLYVSEQIICT
jgi:hypothetical protein